MSESGSINILIAEDNDISREMLSGLLRTQGYRIHGAIDGESAIKVVIDNDIDLALVDVNMAPTGGFEFIRYLLSKDYKIPVVLVTGDELSDLLMQANALGVVQVIQKPIDPSRLLQTVQRILKRRGLSPERLTLSTHEAVLSPEDLMKRAVALADRNVKTRYGGPFGAVIASAEGKILGEGVNGITSRVDPTAHAEVMAIRQAADKLGRADLSDCVLYCSSSPTLMGQALIESVGIKKVFFGLSNDDVSAIRKPITTKTEYKQIGHTEALSMFQAWQKQKDKLVD